jgi:hypothetical protein
VHAFLDIMGTLPVPAQVAFYTATTHMIERSLLPPSKAKEILWPVSPGGAIFVAQMAMAVLPFHVKQYQTMSDPDHHQPSPPSPSHVHLFERVWATLTTHLQTLVTSIHPFVCGNLQVRGMGYHQAVLLLETIWSGLVLASPCSGASPNPDASPSAPSSNLTPRSNATPNAPPCSNATIDATPSPTSTPSCDSNSRLPVPRLEITSLLTVVACCSDIDVLLALQTSLFRGLDTLLLRDDMTREGDWRLVAQIATRYAAKASLYVLNLLSLTTILLIDN